MLADLQMIIASTGLYFMKLSSKPRLALVLVISIVLPLCFATPTFAQIQANLQHTLTNMVKIYGAVWSPDGNRVITWMEDKQAVVWDANTGNLLFSITHGGLFTTYRSPLYSPDGKFIASFQDKTLFIWDAENGSQLHIINSEADIDGILWNNTGSEIAAWSNFSSPNSESSTYEAIIGIWKAIDGTQTTTIHQENVYTYDIQFSPDDFQIAALFTGENGGIRVWNTTDGSEITTLRQNGSLLNGIGNVEWINQGTQISFSGIKGIAFIANNPTGDHIIDFHNDAWIWKTSWSPDQNRMLGVLMNNRVLPIWNGQNGEIAQSLNHTHYVMGATWSRDSSHILTWSIDGNERGSINLWDAQSGVELLNIPYEAKSVEATWNTPETQILGWFPSFFGSRSDGTFRIWDSATGAEIFSGKNTGLLSPVWSADGNRLLSWQENQTFIWKFE